MKRSNLLLWLLSVILLSGLFITDHLLALQYRKVNLGDPYKNYQSVAVQPFKALRISGGNGYAINIMQDKNYAIRLMNSRKGFFKMETCNDTLLIKFTVASQQFQKAELCPVGLIITMPRINFLQLSGTNNEVSSFQQDSLTIRQDNNTVTRLKEIRAGYLNLQGSGLSYFDFALNNKVKSLSVNMQNRAAVNFNQVSFETFSPVLRDSAAIVVFRQALEQFRNAVPGPNGSQQLQH